MIAAGVLVLASASAARQRMLQEAGIAALVDPAAVDEDGIKAHAAQEGLGPAATALALADAKAVATSDRHPGAFVIGADQILVCAGRVFDKPRTMEDARAALRFLRNRSHRLVSAVSLAHDRHVVWRHAQVAALTMRPFSEAFLDRYLEEAGEEVLSSVGAYRVEERGVQLFSHIEGDHFTILGLPLLPLMSALRERGLLDR